VRIHLRQQSHCIRFGFAESPSPKRHRKHDGSSSSGVRGLSGANSGEMRMWMMGVPLSRSAFATWNGHVKRHHSTRYDAVRLGLVL